MTSDRPPPRTAAERKRDTLARLATDVDTWVATADRQGNAYLVPLSFFWDGAALTMATVEESPTARNLRSSGRPRLAIGSTRDVILIDGTVAAYSLDTVPPELADEFAARLWDVRKQRQAYGYFRVTPQQIQAWREGNELSGRDLMCDGTWLV